jgi:ribosome-interacting GTPase 1
MHAEIILKEDSSEDDFIDVLEGNRVYIPCLHVFNKIDRISQVEAQGMRGEG